MNNLNFPFPPMPINKNNYYNYVEEIERIKEKLINIEERIKKIEIEKENSYLKKDDNYYMI